jgi:hypothetical protein
VEKLIFVHFACDECGFDNTKHANAGLVAMIEACAPQWAEPLSDERPSPGVWSAREYAAHYANVIEWYADRIDRLLTEDRPQLSGWDFSVDPPVPADVVAAIAQQTDRVVGRLRGLSVEQWQRVGIGSSDGAERDVRNLASRIAHEGFHHLRDIGKHP